MPATDSIRQALLERDLDAVESEWLSMISEAPEDVDAFVRVANGLGEESSDLAGVLLELLDAELQEHDLWSARLDLIRGAGKSFLKAGRIHDAAIETLKKLYHSNEEALAVLMPEVGLDKGKDETPKLWDKIERLRNLLTYEVGTVVAMADKGVGRVVDVNLKLQALKVDFERAKGVSVGFRAAGKLLQLLPDNHVLRRKLEDPESLAGLGPSDLLRITLESYERPMTGAEVREVVEGLVPKTKWSSWWTAARKHPQVIASSGSKRAYSWAETTADAANQLWQEFGSATVAKKIDLLKRAANQDAEVRDRMIATLREDLGSRTSKGLPTAFEIWYALERQPGGAEWDPRPTLAELRSPQALLRALGNRLHRESALELLREVRSDWIEIFEASFLDESDHRTLAVIASAVQEAAPERGDSLLDQAVLQGRKAPGAFTYVAERAASEAKLRAKRPLRLMKQILAATGDDAFSPFRSRLLVLCESGGTVPRALSSLEPGQASEAQEAIQRARGLDEYLRQPLLTALELKFPDMRKNVEQPLYATAESLARKREELRQLLEEEIPANRTAIQVAREMGDLRENFEYKSARQRHEYLSARATALSRQLDRAQPLDFDNIDPSEVRIGTRVALLAQNAVAGAGQQQLTILGPWESSPSDGVVSYESEMAQKLLGKRPGDEVSLSGDLFEISQIEIAAVSGSE